MKLAEDDRLEVSVPAAMELESRFGLSVVLDLAASKDASARGWGATLLARHDSDESRRSLDILLGDPDPDVKSKAMMSFAAICKGDGDKRFDELQLDSDPVIRAAATQGKAIVAARRKLQEPK